MAEPFDTLMQVQERDTSLDQLRHRRDALPERAALAEVGDLRSRLGRSMGEVQALVDGLAGRQRHLEEQIAATAKRRHEIEQRMQSGAISASRDLQAMDHEVGQLAERQSHLEEAELALLEEQEPLDARLDEDRAASASLTVESDRLTSSIAQSEAEIDAAIAAEAEARDRLFPSSPRVGGAVRTPAVPSRRGGRGAPGGGPVRRMPPDPAIGRRGADPSSPAR